MARSRPLTLQEVRFARHVAEYGSAIEAYKAAGYRTEGRTESALYTAASALLRKPLVKEFLCDLRDAAAGAASVTFDRLVREHARIAFGRRRHAFDRDGNLLPPAEWSDDVDALVVAVESVSAPGKPTTVKRVKFERRRDSLKELAALLGYRKGDDAAAPSGTPAGPAAVVVLPRQGPPRGAAAG
jgi:hypothetical protein